MIISLRGTHGSGKSTVVRGIFDRCVPKPLYGVLGPRRPEAYALTVPKGKIPLYVIGPYISQCGGCDDVQPYDLIPVLISKYAERGHVLFEGALVGCTYGRVGEFISQWKKDVVIVVLDTPLEECIRRVQSRRAKRSDRREFNPTNLQLKYKQVADFVERVKREDMFRLVHVSDTTAADTILKLAREAPRHAPPQPYKSAGLLV